MIGIKSKVQGMRSCRILNEIDLFLRKKHFVYMLLLLCILLRPFLKKTVGKIRLIEFFKRMFYYEANMSEYFSTVVNMMCISSEKRNPR